MRTTLFVLLVTITQVFASSTYSQNVRISLSLRNASIREILGEIENKSEFFFMYDATKVDVSWKTDIECNDLRITDILDRIFREPGIAYEINNRQIALSNVKNVSLTVQNIQKVSGRVTDDSGSPLPGVTVMIKGTNKGTITDFDGKYNLTNVSDDGKLVFSFVGMKSQEVKVAGKTAINVTMIEETVGIDEVIAVGYGTQKKVNLTGAVAQVTSEKLENRAISSVGEGLQGLIPNLNVSFSTGEPGQSAGINIRGYTSINGGGPLILVDGVAMDINLINPSDIATVTVLKDASSSAIYGARASFGVVLVTTKKGTKKKTTFQYDFEYSLSAPIIKVKPIGNSYDYATIKNIQGMNDSGSLSYKEEEVAGIKAYYEDPVNNPEWAVVDGEFQFYGYSDFRKILLKDAYPTRKHNLSISGGSDKLNYYISAGYIDKDGLYKVGDPDYYRRLNLLMKLELKATDWLTFNYGVTFNNSKTDDPHVYGGNSEFTLDGIVRNRPTYAIQMPYSEEYPQFEGMYFVSAYAYFAKGGREIRNTDDLWMTTGTEIDLAKHLKVKADFSYNIYNKRLDEAAPKITMLGTQLTLADPIDYSHTANDYASNDIWNNRYYAFNAYTEYENTFQGGHYLKALAGFNQEYKKFIWNFAKANELVNVDNPLLNLTYGTRELDYSASEWAIRGAFYRLNYNYKERYLLELSGRYDATSRFPKKDRYNFFPSFSAGWRISEENFMAGTRTFLDNLKVRASYGTLGNQLLGNDYYPYIADLGFYQSIYVMTGKERTSTITPSGLVSPSLTWETVVSKNIGIDFTILKQRLDFSFDYFTRETKNMLMKKEYPEILGTDAPKENAADLKTKGWEAVLSWRDKVGNDFRYDIQLSLADALGEITKYDNPTGSLNEYYVGQKLGEIWGYETVGIFQDQVEIDNSFDQTKLGANWKPGDIHYANLNDDEEISPGDYTLDNPGDRKIIGNSTARYSFGISLNTSYKGWFAGIFFQGIGKQDYWPGGRKFLPFNSSAGLMQHHLDYWSEDNKDAYFYRPSSETKNINVQTRYLQDAAYIRLKNLTIGYNLPSVWTKKVFIENAKIFFTGQNLWEASKLRHPLVPEEKSGEQKYPFQRVYALGLKISF